MLAKTLVFLTFLTIFGQVYSATDKILCYYASWAIERPSHGKVAPTDLDPNLCTHINYAFMGLYENGSIEILQPEVAIDQGALKGVSDLKKKNPKLKTIISIGGWELGTPTFSAIAKSQEKRAVLAQSSLDFLRKYNYDGIDIDWEFPVSENKADYILLLRDLKAALAPHGYLLTVAVASNPQDAGYDVKAMNSILDIINVMTYDYHSSWSGKTAQNSPLYASRLEKGWEIEFLNCNASINNWIREGASPGKLAIGVGFYGHSFQLANPANNGLGAPTRGAAAAGPYTDNQGTLGYNELCEFHKSVNVVFDNEQKVPYLYDAKGLWVGYDNPFSVGLKALYAREMKLAGVMVWSVDTDDVFGFCGVKRGLLQTLHSNLFAHQAQ